MAVWQKVDVFIIGKLIPWARECSKQPV